MNDNHHRHSIRLKDFDYSSAGAYFVTICTENRANMFKMESVRAMIEKWWNKIPTKFDSVDIDEHIVMPNHFHGIIVIEFTVDTISQRKG